MPWLDFYPSTYIQAPGSIAAAIAKALIEAEAVGNISAAAASIAEGIAQAGLITVSDEGKAVNAKSTIRSPAFYREMAAPMQ